MRLALPSPSKTRPGTSGLATRSQRSASTATGRSWSKNFASSRPACEFLTGFLLTLPFQQRFSQLTHPEKALYLATVCASIAATAFLQAPVSVHRGLFRRHQRDQAVLLAHYLSIVGIALLGCAVVGVTALIFEVVAGTADAVVVSTLSGILLLTLWLAVPLGMRESPRTPQQR